MARLLVGITAHGFGHLAQTAPVVAALRNRLPALDITVRTSLPARVIEARIPPPVRIVASRDDFGLVMASPFDVDSRASFDRYARLHERFRDGVVELAKWMREERFDGVLANISYLLSAAAGEAGIPALAMSSLNWLDIFRFYCGRFEGAGAVATDIAEAYQGAACIARIEPAMAMPQFETVRIGAAIAMGGNNRRDELRRHYGARGTGRVVVFALGGVPPGEPPGWSADLAPEHVLIGPERWAGRGPWRSPDETGLPFTDLLASADAVVARPGYGTVTEVAAAGVPAILLTRGDWPEEPGLVGWLKRHGRCIYFGGSLPACRPEEIFALCDRLAAMPAPPPPATGGEEQAADLMVGLLRGTGWAVSQ